MHRQSFRGRAKADRLRAGWGLSLLAATEREATRGPVHRQAKNNPTAIRRRAKAVWSIDRFLANAPATRIDRGHANSEDRRQEQNPAMAGPTRTGRRVTPRERRIASADVIRCPLQAQYSKG